MRDWIVRSQTRQFVIPNFEFDAGRRMELRLAYRTLGNRLPDDRSTVLLLHGTTGSSSQYLQSEMADPLFAPGAPLDLNHHFIILPDAIGHGESCRPSEGLYTEFPRYTYGDILRSQYHLVTDALGVRHLRLVLGTSMGGMLTWLWGTHYPDLMDALMPIACLPEPISGRNLLFRRLMLAMITSDPAYPAKAADAAVPSLGRAWNLFEMMTQSVAGLVELAPNAQAADAHLRNTAARAMSTENAVDVVWELDASRDYDPRPHLDRIKAQLMAVNFEDDEINPTELGGLEEAIRKVARGRAVTLASGPGSRGHQMLRSAATWSPCLAELLRSLGAKE